jgi:hypothetical protein
VTEPTAHGGAIVWAVAAQGPERPFRVLQPDGSATRFSDADDLARAVRTRQMPGAFELVVPAKVRPVVLLQDRPRGRFADFAALRLVRVEKFAPSDQDTIRRGQEPTLLHLGQDEARYGLAREYAVLLTSLHRVHRTSIVGQPIGRVDRADLRTIGERVVAFTDLDLSDLIVRRAARLVRYAERGGPERGGPERGGPER